MTRFEAYIEKTWTEHGLANVIVARIRENGAMDYAAFLVDVWCLGVKDAFVESDVQASDLRELIEERMPESMRNPIHPACAKKLIEGAIAFAERLGFAPHRDFRKARKVLSGLDASTCPTEFAYGHEGRPCYVRGPDDSEERVDRVLAILEARVGPDGYDYDPGDDEGDDILALRRELLTWLEAEPPGVPRFYNLSGMITALHVCPSVVMPTKLTDAMWPGGRAWSGPDEVGDFTALLMEYWTYIGDLLRDAAAPDAPPEAQALDVWIDDFTEDSPVPIMAATVEWCAGFLHATVLWPDAWGDALARADLAPCWEVVRWWAKLVERPDNKDLIANAATETPPRTISTCVVALSHALRPSEPAPDRN